MKKMICAITMAILVSVVVMAQPGQGGGGGRRSPEERAKMEAQRLREQLVLTDTQTVKFEKVLLKYENERREAFKNREDTALMRKTVNEIDIKIKADVKVFLTAEQYTKYEKIAEDLKGRMGRGPRGGGDRGQGGPGHETNGQQGPRE